MADRRMFSKTITDSDLFLDMPASTQALYFHLAMHADDDGFVGNPKKIMRMVAAGEDDAKLLVAKKFLIPFESGVVVIRHWKIHNYIQKDRYHETIYTEEKAALCIQENRAYSEKSGNASELGTSCIHGVSDLDAEIRLGENREVSIDENAADKPPTRNRFTPPTVDEVKAYCTEKCYAVDPDRFVDYYTSNGWKVGKNPMKDWKAAVRNWNGKEQTNGKTESKPLWTVGTVV